MPTFSDLPLEIHHRILLICAAQGHIFLANYARLSRAHLEIARPFLHNSVDLSKSEPDSLSEFIYNFAPHHRTDITRLAIAFRPSPPRCPFDELDQSLSAILSLTGMVSELEIKLETTTIEQSFELTLPALERLTRLGSLTIRGDGTPMPRLQLILDGLPRLSKLHTLRLEGLQIVMPTWAQGESTVRAVEITNCFVTEPNASLGAFVNLFGPKLTSLKLGYQDISTLNFCTPQLTRLWLASERRPTKRAQADSVLGRQRQWLCKVTQFGPIRQLVLEDQLLFDAGVACVGSGVLEDVCSTGIISDFLGSA
ncbi:hypothetical protein CROQUDRAFT_131351 [Cronartium quercuum f. sp. fusiforme G11]|uniref:Uncharacterized protein n=1 Tax=Cronartium quercuum f. sp. fusiforme G11 TaxID=708437 RepID=A0A9P6TG60_9BASI|nr:hypothetical protein CROQUDRAFT_131351 [Cronartium quercuum f. sp. fusiforme G11]